MSSEAGSVGGQSDGGSEARPGSLQSPGVAAAGGQSSLAWLEERTVPQ